MIGRKIIGRGQLVERLLASRITGQEDNWAKDNSSSGQLVERIIGRGIIRLKTDYFLTNYIF